MGKLEREVKSKPLVKNNNKNTKISQSSRNKTNKYTMFRLLPNLFLILLVAFPVTVLLSAGQVKAQEDPVEDEVNDDDGPIVEDETDSKVETEDEAADSESESDGDATA